MEIRKAFLEGLRRTNRTPGLLLALFLFNFAIALPMAATMSRAIESSIGPSAVHENLRSGFDLDWFGEFQSGRADIGTTLSPSIIGSGALMNNIETLLDGSFFNQYTGIIGLGLLYVIAWTFFAGGIIDTYQENGGFSRERFAAAAARYFFRFLQLVVMAGILYYCVYRYVGRPLFNVLTDWSRDWMDERPILFLTMSIYALVFFIVTLINVVFDYAKIHAVLEDRSNMLAAAFRGFAFVIRHPAKTLGLYYLIGILAIFIMAAYGFVAPGAGQSTVPTVVLAFLAGQIYLLARIWIKLVFLAGQTVMMTSHSIPASFAESAPPATSVAAIDGN